MDNREMLQRFVIGFLVGGLIGYFTGVAANALMNWAVAWLGKGTAVENIWTAAIGFAVFLALSMGVTMMQNPFGD